MAIVTLEATRTTYTAEEAATSSITVGELIRHLQNFYDEDDVIIVSNDNGYTYGSINTRLIKEWEEE